jgi:short-subunit dehydrogenase
MKRIAIISGASSGIGREIARDLAARGEADELWLIARRADRLAALAGELACPGRIFALDLLLPDATGVIAAALAAEVEASVSFLIAAAGVGYAGAFAEGSAAEAENTIRLNCIAATALVHVALPYMAAGGRILFLASAAAFVPQPYFAVYAASKAYLLSFARALSTELRARQISVTAVCPGPVDTEFFGDKGVDPRKRRYMAEPTRVARGAVKAALRGRRVYTPTAAMKLCRLAAKLLPHGLLIRFFGK